MKLKTNKTKFYELVKQNFESLEIEQLPRLKDIDYRKINGSYWLRFSVGENQYKCYFSCIIGELILVCWKTFTKDDCSTKTTKGVKYFTREEQNKIIFGSSAL